MYRPFVRKYYYSDPYLSNRSRVRYYNPGGKLAITTSSVGDENFSAFVINEFGDSGLSGSTQIYQYLLPITAESITEKAETLFDDHSEGKKHEHQTNIIDKIKLKIKENTSHNPSEIEVFYYIYAILNHKNYLRKYSNDLKKSLPRIPISKNFLEFVALGKSLANIHLNFDELSNNENIKNYLPDGLDEITLKSMNIGRKTQKLNIKGNDIATGIEREFEVSLPPNIHDYLVNGKSPIKWAVEYYKVSTDEETGIKIDPNPILREMGGLRKVLNNLILVTEESLKLIEKISKIDFQ